MDKHETIWDRDRRALVAALACVEGLTWEETAKEAAKAADAMRATREATERRVFEGEVTFDERRNDPPYVIDDRKIATGARTWLRGLDGKRVRITVEVLP